MLKIKDNVDLKELEKFGFIYSDRLVKNEGMKAVGFSGYYKPNFIENYMYIVNETNRRIELPVWELDTLYDLIKADLVEKIEEEI